MGIIRSMYNKMLCHRYDGAENVKYFSYEDFPGMKAEPFSFMSGENLLRGNFYSYEPGKKLIVFAHGIGGGHRSYMKEIDILCKNGFTVMAYDNTGCFASEGKSIRGLSQSPADLDRAIQYIKDEGIFEKYESVSVVGHSWGGFAAGNISAYHKDIKSIVVLSGFITVKSVLDVFTPKMWTPIRKFALKRCFSYEKKANPGYAEADTRITVQNSAAKYLFIHSKDDNIVPYSLSTELVEKECSANNVEFLICDGKLHNPNYTEDAVKYMGETFKNGSLRDADWDRMTAQDEAVWERILAFLND